MAQITLTICFGAITGWFYVLMNGLDDKLDTVDHMLLGIMGALLGLVGYREYLSTTVGGHELYSLLISLLTASAVLAIGRNFAHKIKLPTKFLKR